MDLSTQPVSQAAGLALSLCHCFKGRVWQADGLAFASVVGIPTAYMEVPGCVSQLHSWLQLMQTQKAAG